ncbi:MAG: hypothetical protein JWQ87_3562 [Candidatus Sulfotelmatobacter sp.]|nr:hypothetical protein [Candidatus Sulfotelmatobacter sp.]
MTKNSGSPKSRAQELANVIKTMDHWMQHKTRLILQISTPLFYLVLRGRIVGRQQSLFLFDSYGQTCRVPVVPERYNRVLCNQKGPALVTFETSGIEGKLEMMEDDAEPMFEELCVDWVISKMADDLLTSDAGEQTTQRSRVQR